MVISRTKEIQIQNFIKAGYPQRSIATEADVCLSTVNNRNQLFQLTNPTKRAPENEHLEVISKQHIRYYLAEEKSHKNFR